MRPGEKEVLRASMLRFAEGEVRNQSALLRQYLYMRHPLTQGMPPDRLGQIGWHSLIRTQIVAVRRAKILLEAAKLWDIMRTNSLVISAVPPKHGGIMRYESHPVFTPEEDAKGRQVEEAPYDDGNDPRWRDVTDDTVVMWNNQNDTPEVTCRWGDLMLADRKTVEMHPDGTLHGGYPF